MGVRDELTMHPPLWRRHVYAQVLLRGQSIKLAAIELVDVTQTYEYKSKVHFLECNSYNLSHCLCHRGAMMQVSQYNIKSEEYKTL